MRLNNNLLLFLTLFCISNTLHAQVEAAHLFTKGESSTGYGIFIRPGFPIGKADEISIEAGLDYFTHDVSHIADIPLLMGYRHTLNGSGAGFYLDCLCCAAGSERPLADGSRVSGYDVDVLDGGNSKSGSLDCDGVRPYRHIRDQERALGIGLRLQRRLGAVIDCGDDCPGNDGLGLIDDGAAERAGDDALAGYGIGREQEERKNTCADERAADNAKKRGMVGAHCLSPPESPPAAQPTAVGTG